ncbi:hypothetical protein C7H09_14070 [Marinobacter fuscus]|uniref:DUF4365 domain-containing protein n=2 Tax=Marinobacter fuscus TaxID=2109942 RepID=A0A2T1K6I7_9GAMM|nr:hypothetical protein C7H09_14070 [Marinobacter fuscus]
MDSMKLEPIKYEDLNAKAKETYNFHKIAAILADYGYNSIWLSNDWNGADFIAVHIDGVSDIKIQLKGGVSFAQKYRGKNLYIGFIEQGDLYLYPHDDVLEQVEPVISDKKWIEKGTYFQTKITSRFIDVLAPYKIRKIT